MTDTTNASGDAGEGEGETNAAVSALATGDTPAWYGEIADPELKTWAENKKFADPVTALKSQRELEKLIGSKADSIGLPEEGKDLSEWQGWDKLGVPKEAKAYVEAVKMPELPEGMQMDQALVEKAFEIGAAKRIPPAHMQEMVNLFAETQTAQFNAAKEIDAADRKAVDDMYTEWGAAKPENLELAKRAAKELGFDDDLIGEASETQGSAKFIAKMLEVGKRLSEGGLITGSSGGMNAQQAADELAAMKADPEIAKAVMDTSHPRHAIEKERFTKLSALSVPNG